MAGGFRPMGLVQRRTLLNLTATVLLAALHAPAWADTLRGRVIGIADGDTLTVLASDRQYRVRLAGIDAPEMHQPFGQTARQALAAATFDQPVVIIFHKRDRYGRLVGKVLVDGKDAGLAMLDAGLAWHYLAFAKEQELSDRHAYAEAEQAARLAHRGLWVQAQPLPPWEYRLARRH